MLAIRDASPHFSAKITQKFIVLANKKVDHFNVNYIKMMHLR